MPIFILKISGMCPIELYIIVYFDIDINPHIVSHQEHSFAPKGCDFVVRSSLLCCCSINRSSRSRLLCSRSTLVASLKSSIASTSQPAAFSSHSVNSFWTYDKNISLSSVTSSLSSVDLQSEQDPWPRILQRCETSYPHACPLLEFLFA